MSMIMLALFVHDVRHMFYWLRMSGLNMRDDDSAIHH